MKRILSLTITYLFVLIMMFFVVSCDITPVVITTEKTITTNEPIITTTKEESTNTITSTPLTNITIHFLNDEFLNWQSVNAYYWYGNGDEVISNE